jgi:hypothetical protein
MRHAWEINAYTRIVLMRELEGWRPLGRI